MVLTQHEIAIDGAGLCVTQRERPHLGELREKRVGRVEAGQHIQRGAIGIEQVVSAVARDRAADLAAVAEVDRDLRHGALGAPVEHELVVKDVRDLRVRVERGAEEAAVRATQIVVQIAEEA